MFKSHGYWRPLGLGGKLGPKFLDSVNAMKWANRNWGVGNWTLQWFEGVKGADDVQA